jgi:hypothetical protein
VTDYWEQAMTVVMGELRATAEDEANGVTDIPVDDLLRLAADALESMVNRVRAYTNDKVRAEQEAAQLRGALERANEWRRDAEDVADGILADRDCALEALRQTGETKWKDAKGIWRPLPAPAWLIMDDPLSPVHPKPLPDFPEPIEPTLSVRTLNELYRPKGRPTKITDIPLV